MYLTRVGDERSPNLSCVRPQIPRSGGLDGSGRTPEISLRPWGTVKSQKDCPPESSVGKNSGCYMYTVQDT